jgi:toxin ParE1/3/4
MNRPVVWSIQARDDFLSIVETIAQDNPDAAGRVAERIMRATVALSTMATGRVGRVDGTYEKVLSGLPYILSYRIVLPPHDDETI